MIDEETIAVARAFARVVGKIGPGFYHGRAIRDG